MKKYILLLIFSLFTLFSIAQTAIQNSGWLAFFNNTKFNNKWGLAFDAQFRSADNFQYLRNVLIRPGITYQINKNQNVTAGYLFTQTYLPQSGTIAPAVIGSQTPDPLKTTLTEHRIWEQYIITHRVSSVFAMHRFRLEQRFIETQNEDIFAQRLRYFFRFIQPLTKTKETFDKGAFVALQNETFFNIQHQSKLNNSFFDQNRAYLAVGYRFSKKIDVEFGYLNQFSNGISANTSNNIAQVAVYSRF